MRKLEKDELRLRTELAELERVQEGTWRPTPLWLRLMGAAPERRRVFLKINPRKYAFEYRIANAGVV